MSLTKIKNHLLAPLYRDKGSILVILLVVGIVVGVAAVVSGVVLRYWYPEWDPIIGG